MTTKPSANSKYLSSCIPKPKRAGHLEIKPDAPKHTLVSEMAVKAGWVAAWQAAVARGDEKRARELEGLMGTNAISELERKG